MVIIRVELILLCFFCLLIRLQGLTTHHRTNIWCKRAEEATNPLKCFYGLGEGPCGPVCLKGPGEVCGGEDDIYGICSEGLTCSNCNRCTGCSYFSLRCFDDGCASEDTYFGFL
ncbi:neuroparsin-A isoform X2 [Eurytemora carolleeae]|uniref:neuroparsin-A isoform X2 n=1 Tax=Eurytemora carolleeae TaxID=1294199 RepID=UPI000C75C41A|nr:neuroparsin-A isoform X2 [Eurytemora carolleeae]|eukprot:XP_023320384.1 neuroparsin-A-like isoform X2 [Eurytemora affinis]